MNSEDTDFDIYFLSYVIGLVIDCYSVFSLNFPHPLLLLSLSPFMLSFLFKYPLHVLARPSVWILVPLVILISLHIVAVRLKYIVQVSLPH